MENETVYIDKAGSEDLVTSHDAQFEITDGYHFNEGRNNTINLVIRKLYDLRIKLRNINKFKKEPAQMVIEVLMNSMYGKHIIKPVETDIIVKDNKDDFEKCISLNYKHTATVLEIKGRYYIERVKSILSYVNYIHCDVECLPVSKRIMNKVVPCCDDCSIRTLFQDTDSIHLIYDDVNKNVDRYKKKILFRFGWSRSR